MWEPQLPSQCTCLHTFHIYIRPMPFSRPLAHSSLPRLALTPFGSKLTAKSHIDHSLRPQLGAASLHKHYTHRTQRLHTYSKWPSSCMSPPTSANQRRIQLLQALCLSSVSFNFIEKLRKLRFDVKLVNDLSHTHKFGYIRRMQFPWVPCGR